MKKIECVIKSSRLKNVVDICFTNSIWNQIKNICLKV